jgi:hypothetical protein
LIKLLSPFLLTASLALSIMAIAFQDTPSFQDLPLTGEIEREIDAQTSQVIFLYGIVCVGGCPIGDYIYSVRERPDVLFVAPPGFTDDDIANLRRGMSVKGRIFRASEKNSEFLKEIARRMKLEDWEENFVLMINNKKIVSIKRY